MMVGKSGEIREKKEEKGKKDSPPFLKKMVYNEIGVNRCSL